jgi:hypothetical protein
MKILFALFTIFVFVAAGSAADINGTWIAQVPDPRGVIYERIFTFRISGENWRGDSTVIGTLKGRHDILYAISEGIIIAETISFAVYYPTPWGAVRINYNGKISGDEIKFTVKQERHRIGSLGSYPQEFVAKKESSVAPYPRPAKTAEIPNQPYYLIRS